MRIDTLTLKKKLTHPTPGGFRGLNCLARLALARERTPSTYIFIQLTAPAEENFLLPVPSSDIGGGWQINYGVQYSSYNANSRGLLVLSDTTCPRPNMQTCEGLQQRSASADKEASQIRVRFLTVNIGTMTGKSREVAEMLNRS